MTAVISDTRSDLWRVIGTELRLAPAQGRSIESSLEYFSRNREFLQTATARATPFLYYLQQEVARRQLPYAILLLPIIESGYRPEAMSPGGAVGLWQLMPATARRFGIEINTWYDGRRDVVSSTRAALDYIEELREHFQGDWALAFAAYNCGERTVERAIERNRRAAKPTDFWSLDLPSATRDYVPRLLALVEIVAHPEAHDVVLPEVLNEPYFTAIDVGGALDLNRVIDWAMMDSADFDRLNAGYLKRFSLETGPSTVLIPLAKAALVQQGLAALPTSERTAPRIYLVKSGDTLSEISKSSGIDLWTLKRANQLSSSRIRVGQTLVLPIPGTAPHATSSTINSNSADYRVHIVQPGDNLWDLARRYGIRVDDIASANQLSRSDTLRVGAKLRISSSQPALPPKSEPDESSGGVYEVRSGDSLWTIAHRLDLTMKQLRAWNGLGARPVLRPGQKLLITPPLQKTPTPPLTAASDSAN